MRNGLVSALCLVAIALLSLPAFADIKAFNAAVSKGDYKAAAAEAASTWPTLDKSRKDIGVIAQEFGYAAFMSGDYTPARTYAEFASTDSSTAADSRLQAVSAILLRLSVHRLKPSDETRDRLMAAMVKRAELPGSEDISSQAIDAVTAWDANQADWYKARESSRLGQKFAIEGGAYFLPERRRMEVLTAVAEAMPTVKPDGWGKIRSLEEAIIGDMDAAPNDDAAKAFVAVFWEAQAWEAALIHGYREAPRPEAVERSERVRKLLDLDRKEAAAECGLSLPFGRFPRDVYDKLSWGGTGAAVVRVDADRTGKITRAELLAAVPNAVAGQMSKFAQGASRIERYKKTNGAECSDGVAGLVELLSFTWGN